MPSSWPQLRRRVAELAAAGPVVFDLVVVSHIDSDHIGGLLPLLASTELDIRFKDVWFNGLTHLPEAAADRPRSVAEGERMVELLGNGDSRVPWNEQFGRAAVVTRGDGAFDTIAFSGGPTLTLLSPTPRRLASLRKTWSRELLRLQRVALARVVSYAVRVLRIGHQLAILVVQGREIAGVRSKNVSNRRRISSRCCAIVWHELATTRNVSVLERHCRSVRRGRVHSQCALVRARHCPEGARTRDGAQGKVDRSRRLAHGRHSRRAPNHWRRRVRAPALDDA
jgi:hypothetical protein